MGLRLLSSILPAIMLTHAASAPPGSLYPALSEFNLQLPVKQGSGVETIKAADLLTYESEYFYLDKVRECLLRRHERSLPESLRAHSAPSSTLSLRTAA